VRSNLGDYSAATVDARRGQIRRFLDQIEDMNVTAWDRARQVDWLAARSKMNQELFVLNVSKPWERDPGFYVDQMLEVGFTELPVQDAGEATLRRRLRAVPELVATARRTLRNIPGDYADLALHNLANADGVGHGHPYRATPPAASSAGSTIWRPAPGRRSPPCSPTSAPRARRRWNSSAGSAPSARA
jgi:hypothetical protein